MRRGRTIIPALLLPLLIVAGAMTFAASHAAEQGEVTEKFRVLFFKKLYAYTTSAQSGRAFKVCVAYEADQASAAEAIAKEFEAIGVPVFANKIEELPGDLKQASAVYILAKKVSDSAKETIARNQAVSGSGSTALAERGDTAIGIGVKANRQPDVVVHLPRLKAEGQQVPAALLTMSMMRVIR